MRIDRSALPSPSPSPTVRVVAGLGLVAALFLFLSLATPAAGAAVPPTGPGPAPADVAAADGGQQRWAPPLAGQTTGVTITDGTVGFDGSRDGAREAASLRGTERTGFLSLGSHRFGTDVNRLDVPITADVPPGARVEADVRGQGPDGRWSEWVPSVPGAPAVLDEPTRTVELRIALIAPRGAPGPTVRAVEVLADRVATAPRDLRPRATHRVFATREGLTGYTTANGHKIRPNDHFVALPSRRALSPKGKGDYSVRVCAETGRCATVPVWDVGPWNTTDDYWNPPALRHRWKDLPTGLPQAQAAFERDHNGGRDGFGRQVKNPAGIDLADGTFYGLGLKANSWVTVDYLWTARSATVGQAVAPAGPVPLRSGPSEAATDVGVVADGAALDLDCQAVGTPVAGTQGTSNRWLRVGAKGADPASFAPAAFITGAPPLPPCAG